MLFRKDIEPRCAYCQFSQPLSGEQLTCLKRGIVTAGSHCRKFAYDPLKRVPPKPAALNTSGLKDEDFSL